MDKGLKLFVGEQVRDGVTIEELRPAVEGYVIETQEPDKVRGKLEELLSKWEVAIEGNNTAVLKQDEKVVGIVRLKTIKAKGADGEESVYEIENAYVDPSLRRTGLTMNLLEKLLENLYATEPNATIVTCTKNQLVQSMCAKLVDRSGKSESGGREIGLADYVRNYSTENLTPEEIQREVDEEGWTAYKFPLNDLMLKLQESKARQS